MLNHKFLKPPQLLGRETKVPRQADRLQLELGRKIIPIDMDMRRLIGFMAVEVEAIGAASQDGRHDAPAGVIWFVPFLPKQPRPTPTR
jgi:hypothetical protein